MELLLYIILIVLAFSILKLSISTAFKIMLYLVIISIILGMLGF